jgi:hypothetical protein
VSAEDIVDALEGLRVALNVETAVRASYEEAVGKAKAQLGILNDAANRTSVARVRLDSLLRASPQIVSPSVTGATS